MNKYYFLVLPVVLLILVVGACGQVQKPLVNHPSLLPSLTKDTEFPRCTKQELAAAGFPDHMHMWNYTTWVTPVDEDGLAYGPGSLCKGRVAIARDDVGITDTEKQFGQFRMRHNPAYTSCDMLPFLELLDYAWHFVPDLLGLTTADTLVIDNPDNAKQYQEQTGYGVWRLYYLAEKECILQSYGVLRSRTLDGHAAFMLITDWLLQKNLGNSLPPWLHQGLIEYIGEDGVHLVNYMAQFRPQGDVLFSPPLTDAILGSQPDPDKNQDREMYRRACYSAFLMVHQLVEHEGGLAAMREFLDLASAGVDLDEAATTVWRRDMAKLASSLDPVKIGEPAGSSVESRNPFRQPKD